MQAMHKWLVMSHALVTEDQPQLAAVVSAMPQNLPLLHLEVLMLLIQFQQPSAR